MSTDVISVDRVIEAPAARIFDLLSDASQHPVFDGSGTVQEAKSASANGGSQSLTLGSQFGMSMKWGVPYATKNTVVEYELNRRIAWRTAGFFGIVGGRVWRYELQDEGGRTVVRESWDISRDHQRFFLRRSNLPRMTRSNMEQTLERLDDAVTADR